MIASASDDETVILWSRDGTLLETPTGDQVRIWDISFSPDSKTVASASMDNDRITLWSREPMLLKALHGHDSWVT